MSPGSTPLAGGRGMSLVELMVSLVLIGIGLVGVVSMYSYTATTREYARNASLASAEAQGIVERVQAMPYADIKVDPAPYDVSFLLPDELGEGSASLLIEQYALDLKRVTVTVEWRPGKVTGGRIRMTTLIGPKA